MSQRRVAVAQHWARTAPLPSPGTFQENLLIELANREKNLEFAKLYVMADIVGAGLGVEPQRVGSLLDLYEAELFHDTYDPEFVARKRTEIQERTTVLLRKAAAAQRKARETAAAVEAMTVSEEDLKPPGG